LIQICGIEITNQDIIKILNYSIYNSRWNKTPGHDELIYELINLNTKPIGGFPKYTEYYNNLKIINK